MFTRRSFIGIMSALTTALPHWRQAGPQVVDKHEPFYAVNTAPVPSPPAKVGDPDAVMLLFEQVREGKISMQFARNRIREMYPMSTLIVDDSKRMSTLPLNELADVTFGAMIYKLPSQGELAAGTVLRSFDREQAERWLADRRRDHEEGRTA